MPRPYGMLPALCLLALTAVALGGCDQPAGVTQSSPPAAAPTEPNYKDFGDFEIHYNALRTDELKAEVARAYGIERSPNRVMLNVSLLRKNPDGSTQPVDGTVRASAYNLNGQLKDLEMRRITEGPSVYFIGEVGIAGTEILVFDIEAAPANGGSQYKAQFKREFFAG